MFDRRMMTYFLVLSAVGLVAAEITLMVLWRQLYMGLVVEIWMVAAICWLLVQRGGR